MHFKTLPFLRIPCFFSLIFLTPGFANPLQAQSIAAARAQPIGSNVTVRGIVTSGAELGKIRYLQDGSAGLAAFPGAGSVPGFENAVSPGDSIEVSGTLVSFHELLEITPITAFQVISSGHPLPEAKLLSLDQISDGFESQLVEFDCISFGNAGGLFSNAGSYDIADRDGKVAKIYLPNGHPLIGSTIPELPVRLRSVLSIYDEFQLLPRNSDDFQASNCFFFTENLSESDISTNGFRVQWQTNVPSDAILHLGTTPVPNLAFAIPQYSTDHDFLLSNLLPGTIYWVQIEAFHNNESIFSEPRPFATQSLSSGQIKVFFNHGIDTSFSNGFTADGETFQAVLAETLNRINAAQQTLDVAMYNNNRSDITQALKAAHERGVRVRYITSIDPGNSALMPPPPFPVLYTNFNALMHNKFMAIDADLTDKAWVMSGSLNWTNTNMVNDFNNTLFIQDQSLARTYELEFEEMYGSDGALPEAFESRYGSFKFDNTPHHFIIGGHAVESYFSPSDGTTSQIEAVLREAQQEAIFATFSFTKNELSDRLVEVHQNGVSVRGIMENISDVGAEYNYLLTNGVKVRHHSLPGDFHHKYAVVDATDWNSDPTVVTGSHNWSVTAETANDENTLVLHDPKLASLFKAEFEKRWGEFPSGVSAAEKPLLSAVPNPAAESLEIQGLPSETGVLLVKNALGQVMVFQDWQSGTAARLDVSGLLPGQYFVTFISDHVFASLPFQKI